MSAQDDFNARLKRVNDAIGLQEPDRLPMTPFIGGLPYALYNKGSHRAEFYDSEAIIEPVVRYHKEFEPDVAFTPALLQSGKANEIAESNMIDWPGKPGTIVPDTSTHQVFEREYMTQEEYDEAIRDWTGFLIRKYIPRAYPGLKGFAAFNFNPAVVLGISALTRLMSPEVLEAFDKIKRIAQENSHTLDINARITKELTDLGFPPLMTGMGEVPFDAISDYFRGTAGMFDDQMECPEKVVALGEIIRDVQISSWQYFTLAPMPIKRVFFPLHKGMDGFISPAQYEELYWKPFQDMLRSLINIGVTPFIYTEGRYDSRIDFMAEQLKEFPGKCLVHFEEVDFKKAKKAFTGIAAISGGLNPTILEWGTKEQVVDRMKWLIDHCAAGGGYIFDTGATIENAKHENIVAMFETAKTYGKK